MKRYLPLIFIGIICILQTKIYCQNYYTITFEGMGHDEYPNDSQGLGTWQIPNTPFCVGHSLLIDTVSNANNIWQIGMPQKQILSDAYSNPNVIITDSLNFYPINDTSSFTLSHIQDYYHSTFEISGMYYVNSDTLTDFGKIEFSVDHGVTWIDLITDSNYINTVETSMMLDCRYIKPILTGNSNGWKNFCFPLENITAQLNPFPDDTLIWRFTFISDGIQTNKGGLMFDSIVVWDTPPLELQEIILSDTPIISYPNPTHNKIKFDFINGKSEEQILKIYNSFGELKSEHKIPIIVEIISLDVSDYSEGIYFYEFINLNGGKVFSGKFIKE